MVHPNGAGAAVDRIILTPPVDKCVAPAKIEFASAQLNDSPAALLGTMNPCAIPEKELKPKDCKHCQRFSGADVAMRVLCGTQVRVIPEHIFEDYWFNPNVMPPKNTSSILGLLKRLDDAVGPGVMDKRVFDLPNNHEPPAKSADSPVFQRLGAGEYDNLFRDAPDIPSELYLSAQNSPTVLSIHLLTSVPYLPESFQLAEFPSCCKSGYRRDGQVNFTADVDSAGAPTNISLEGDQRILQWPIWKTIGSWKYPKEGLQPTSSWNDSVPLELS